MNQDEGAPEGLAGSHLPWAVGGTHGTPTASSSRDAAPVRMLDLLRRVPRTLLRVPILIYRYTLSSFMGRHCRYLPTCSEYADEAISRHGAWAGGWMGAARLCRCHPWGGSGFDPVPQCLSAEGRWHRPWRYGIWRQSAD